MENSKNWRLWAIIGLSILSIVSLALNVGATSEEIQPIDSVDDWLTGISVVSIQSWRYMNPTEDITYGSERHAVVTGTITPYTWTLTNSTEDSLGGNNPQYRVQVSKSAVNVLSTDNESGNQLTGVELRTNIIPLTDNRIKKTTRYFINDFYGNVEDGNLKLSLSDINGIGEISVKVQYSPMASSHTYVITETINNSTPIHEFNIAEMIENDLIERGLETRDIYIWGVNVTQVDRISNESRTSIRFDIGYGDWKMNKNYNRDIEVDKIEQYILSDYNKSFENVTRDWSSWIGEAIGGFMNFEIAPYISIGGIFCVIIAISLTIVFLKMFMGG